jgi:hypothetical protein
MFFSRRQVLKAAVGSAVLSLMGQIPFIHPAQSGVFSGRRLVTMMGPTHEAAIIDLDSLNFITIPLGFNPHSFVQNPRNPDRVWAVCMTTWTSDGSDGTGSPPAVEMDLRERKIVQSLRLPENHGLTGHGFFTPDGSVFFSVRLDVDKGFNYLTGFDAADCRKIVADYPLVPGGVHDSRLLPDGTAMISSSGMTFVRGNEPYAGVRVKKEELIQFDIHSGQTIRAWSMDDDNQIAGHWAALKDGTLIEVGRTKIDGTEPGKVYIGKRDDASLREIPYTDRVKPGKPGELLSLAASDTQHIAVVTDPSNNRLLVIDTERGAFVGAVDHSGLCLAFDERAGRFVAMGPNPCFLDGKGNPVDNKKSRRLKKLGCIFDSVHSLLI